MHACHRTLWQGGITFGLLDRESKVTRTAGAGGTLVLLEEPVRTCIASRPLRAADFELSTPVYFEVRAVRRVLGCSPPTTRSCHRHQCCYARSTDDRDATA